MSFPSAPAMKGRAAPAGTRRGTSYGQEPGGGRSEGPREGPPTPLALLGRQGALSGRGGAGEARGVPGTAGMGWREDGAGMEQGWCRNGAGMDQG